MNKKRLVKPINFLYLYLLIIIAFAIVYSLIGDQFYHSTIGYEEETKNLNFDLLDDINESVKTNYITHYGAKTQYLDENNLWLFDIDNLQVVSARVDGRNLILDFSIEARRQNVMYGNNDQPTEVIIVDNFRLIDTSTTSTIEIGDKKYTVLLFELMQEDDYHMNGIDLEGIDYSKIFATKDFPNEICIVYDEDMLKKIRVFFEANKGFAHNIDGSYLRMLYLSMVTITTLGYGDILPLTNLARILVGIESVLGIVILGWFINSVGINKRT